MDIVPLHISRELQQALKMLNTYLCYRLPPHSSFLNVVERVYGHIESHAPRNDLQTHGTLHLHINDGVQTIAANMVQGSEKRGQ